MSKVAIKGNASGTGTFTVEAPNSNTDRTLVLPDEAGTVLTSGGAIDVDASAPADSVRIDSSGDVLIGTTATTSNERVRIANGNDTRAISFQSSSAAECGYIYINSGGTSVSYSTTSDYRLKENVVDMTGAIDRVKALKPSQFNFIADPDTTVDGFLAHEAQTVVPEAITGTHNEVDDEGNPVYQGIDQSKLVPLLTGALQEAITKIETLETTVADLQTRVTALEATP